jgi:hypothetical protein
MAFSKNVTAVRSVIVGWSFTAVMLIVLVTATLVAAPTLSEFASVTDQVIVRLVLVDVGLSDVDR